MSFIDKIRNIIKETIEDKDKLLGICILLLIVLLLTDIQLCKYLAIIVIIGVIIFLINGQKENLNMDHVEEKHRNIYAGNNDPFKEKGRYRDSDGFRHMPFDPRMGRTFGEETHEYQYQDSYIDEIKTLNKSTKLVPINQDRNVNRAFFQNNQFNEGDGIQTIHDRENQYFRQHYNRNRLRAAIGENNLTSDGHKYGAPQVTSVYNRLPEKTYLDYVGVYHSNKNF